eukprot:COSAG06_NODE_562_length_14275_cov_28.599041_8_plen_117_part_00
MVRGGLLAARNSVATGIYIYSSIANSVATGIYIYIYRYEAFSPRVTGELKVYLDRGSLSTWVTKYGLLHKTQLAYFDNEASLNTPSTGEREREHYTSLLAAAVLVIVVSPLPILAF